MFYVYEWYNTDTNEVFYVGKGVKQRYRKVYDRNADFKNYMDTHNVDVRIVKYFENEQESFEYEDFLIRYYWDRNQCFCNRRYGGCGGVAGIWTEEMRKKMSEENPMKDEEQRLRMSEFNPMKNPETVRKVVLQKSRVVIINGQHFACTSDAAKHFNVHIETIRRWCKRGYDTNYNPCRYADEEQKEFPIKRTNSRQVIIDNKHVFDSVKEGADFLGGNSSNFIKAIKNSGFYKGHQVAYVDQQPSEGNS